MAVDVRKSEFLTYLSYNTSLNINPANVYYQRVRSENKSTNLVQWAFNNPNKRSLLLSVSQIEWEFSLRRDTNNAGVFTEETWTGNQVRIMPKHQFPFQNACSSITTSINSATQTITQPRHYLDVLNYMNISREENLSSCYEYGFPTSSCGHVSRDQPQQLHFNEKHDDAFERSSNTFYDELIRADSNNIPVGRLAGEGTNNATITGVKMVENVIVPPWDAYWCVSKKDMPDHSPWKKMSPVIGNIDRIELSLNFQNLTAGTLFHYYSTAIANNAQPKRLTISEITNATLLLTWYQLPVNMSIPRTIDYNTWDVREYVTPITDLAVNVESAQIDGNLIQLKSMPSFIIIQGRRDVDAADYQCEQFFSDDDGAGGNPQAPNEVHSFDSKLEIKSVNVLLGNRPNVINTTINQKRLYDITARNCKKLAISYNNWRGWLRNNVNAAGLDLGTDGSYGTSNCFLILTGQDLAEELSDGVAFPISFQIQVNFVGRDGVGGVDGGTQVYKLYQHVFYSKHFLRLSQDSGGMFEEQLLNADASRTITQGSSDSINQITDSMSALGSLDRLRQMNGTGGSLTSDYRSRL